jgi:peptidoglycan/LPS O-acetylase OafA/YrhL
LKGTYSAVKISVAAMHPALENPAPLGHLPELDGLRGLAIVLVPLFHFAADLPRNVIFLGPVYFG